MSQPQLNSITDTLAVEENPRPHLRYMPGLDVLRGLAILMVLVYHGLEGEPLTGVVNGGAMGVHLFFILSGFLITGILIDSRSDSDYYRNFYVRRVLRIAPAYLLLIAILKASHIIDWRFVAVCLLYLNNMPTLLGSYNQYGPFWSLSVEEQFYLVWPLVVRKLSLTSLVVLSSLIVVLTPFLRLAVLYRWPYADIQFKTWFLGDFFAAGALFAVAIRTPGVWAKLGRFVPVSFVLGCVTLACWLLMPEPASLQRRYIYWAFRLEPWLLIFAPLMFLALRYPSIAKWRVCRPLVFLANISYGLYLCHALVISLIDKYWGAHTAAPWGYSLFVLRFIVQASISIAIAVVSRRTFEAFFLRLKPKHHRTIRDTGPVPS